MVAKCVWTTKKPTCGVWMEASGGRKNGRGGQRFGGLLHGAGCTRTALDGGRGRCGRQGSIDGVWGLRTSGACKALYVNFEIGLKTSLRVLPVVEVTTPEVSPLIPAAVGRPAIGDRYEPSEASEAGLVVAAARAACCCCCCCCINCCKEGKEGLTNGS